MSNRKEELQNEIKELYNKLDVIDLSINKKKQTLAAYIEEKEKAEKELNDMNSAETKTYMQVQLHSLKNAKMKNQMGIKNIDGKIAQLEKDMQNPREVKEGYEETQKAIAEYKDKKLILQSEISRIERDISQLENKLESVILGKSEADELRQTINDLEFAIKSLTKDIEIEETRNKSRIYDIKETIEEKERMIQSYDEDIQKIKEAIKKLED